LQSTANNPETSNKIEDTKTIRDLFPSPIPISVTNCNSSIDQMPKVTQTVSSTLGQES